jgi:DNA-binding GntR family transcriptional regulator
MAIERLQQSTTADGVVRAVRTAILDGTLSPGSQLRETHTAAQLGISRAPLREALHRLEKEGLVIRIPFRGAFVAEVSPQLAAEIAELRAILEPYAVERGLPRLTTPEGRADLVEAVKALAERTAEGDRVGSLEAHLRVHRELYAASGNQVLFELWKSWESQLRLFLAVDHQALPTSSALAAGHYALLAAIESGDMQEVRRELASHIHSAVPDGTPSPAAAPPTATEQSSPRERQKADERIAGEISRERLPESAASA